MVWNRTRIEHATPGTAVSMEKNDSVNMHKVAESYSVNAADILGLFSISKNILFQVEESATFVYFFTNYNAEPDITPIVFAVAPSVKS